MQRLQIPEPPATYTVCVDGIACFTRGKNGWESVHGTYLASWLDILNTGKGIRIFKDLWAMTETLTPTERAALQYRMLVKAWRRQHATADCYCRVCNLLNVYEEK